MLQVSSITAITIVGLLISLLIVFCGMGIFWAWRRIKLQNNSMLLLSQAQSMAQQRAQTLQTWLEDKMGLDQATVEQIMAKHMQQESTFFQSMQANMVEQNMATGQQLNQSFNQLQNLLKEIPIDNGTVPVKTENQPGSIEIELKIKEITDKNQTLVTELSVIKETMNAVIGEYSRVFELQDDAEAMNASKEKILAQLDALIEQSELPTTTTEPAPTPAAPSTEPAEQADTKPDN